MSDGTFNDTSDQATRIASNEGKNAGERLVLSGPRCIVCGYHQSVHVGHFHPFTPPRSPLQKQSPSPLQPASVTKDQP
jgi:predicted Zn-ribbon and HTH transcriptional regulator